jgi:MFS family permease
MTSIYRKALATPGAARFVPAAFVGRLPLSMIGIGIVLYVQHATDSYGMGGAVAAAATIAEAVAIPRIGRALDRFGQAPVLLLCLAGHLVGVVGLLVAVETDLPRPLWFAAAALVGGLLPPVGASVRARWSARLGGTDLLGAALALEAALDEAIFICGPLLVTVLITLVAPVAGLLTSGVLTTVGTLALSAQRGSDPGPRGAGDTAPLRVFRDPATRALLVVFLAIGVAFGGVDLGTVAFARAEGLGALSGLILALFAAGSGACGLVFGARAGGGALARRFLICAATMAVGMWLPLAAGSVVVLGPLAVLAGATAAPTLISGNALMERLTPAASRTEGFAWLQMALVTGVAIGAPATGRLIDAHGSRWAFAVVAAAGVLIGLAAATGCRPLLAALPSSPRPGRVPAVARAPEPAEASPTVATVAGAAAARVERTPRVSAVGTPPAAGAPPGG